jgi:deazaflavin-dependent oxidoreductase (nitroreductase family)
MAQAQAEERSSGRVTEPHYQEPGWFTRNIFNRVVAGMTHLGISVWGSRVLRVKGRKSGEVRTNPVNLLTHDDTRYLVAPRGETQWVRNLRAAGGNGELALGKKIEAFHATEVADADKPEILRAYLKRWKAEVGVFFQGVSAKSPQEEVERIAPLHPIFKLDS